MISIANLRKQYEPLSVKWNNRGNEITELKNRKYRLCQMKKWRKEVDRLFCEMSRSGEFDYTKMPEMPNHGGALLIKHEVEVALIEIEIDEMEQISMRLWRKMESLFTFNRQNTNYKKITKKKQRELERETCAICYEKHNISQIVTIRSCGHSFGKSCFTDHMNYCYDEKKELTCPCCRNHEIDMMRYRK